MEDYIKNESKTMLERSLTVSAIIISVCALSPMLLSKLIPHKYFKSLEAGMLLFHQEYIFVAL